jgi:Tfp pilus assembly protein PilX
MKTISTTIVAQRRGERGAALVTTLLLATLLLSAGGALILTTSMATSTAIDSTSETQAYYAAEAGLQAALNVLRGNVAPSPVFNGTASDESNKMSFRRAVTAANSNKSGEASWPLRLSRWLTYDTTYTDRVALSSSYSPVNGMAYKVEIQDPQATTEVALLLKLADPNYNPTRLLIKATGYGPKGAQKSMSLLVNRFAFDIQPPAPITIRGADPTTVAGVTTYPQMTFDLGSSSAKKYSGKDVDNLTAPPKPTVAISLPDWNPGNVGVNKGGTVDDPKFGILQLPGAWNTIPTPWTVTTDTNSPWYPTPVVAPSYATPPWFLVDADKARAFLAETQALAEAEGKYQNTNFDGIIGSDNDPDFRFIDGDCELDGGAGLLIVTGDLELTGEDDFHGIVLVLGNGKVTRKGGGNGNILGAWFVAAFNRNAGNFTAPHFDVSGGGNGDFKFSSKFVGFGNGAPGRGVMGLVED